jgi:hypothetical protein
MTSLKGKTYEQIYGSKERAEKQREKRAKSISVYNQQHTVGMPILMFVIVVN